MIFDAKNMFEPKAFICVVKMNITNFNSFFSFKNQFSEFFKILKRDGAHLIRRKDV